MSASSKSLNAEPRNKEERSPSPKEAIAKVSMNHDTKNLMNYNETKIKLFISNNPVFTILAVRCVPFSHSRAAISQKSLLPDSQKENTLP